MTTLARYKHYEGSTKAAVEGQFSLSDQSQQELGFASDDEQYGRQGVRRRYGESPAFDHIPTIEGMGAKAAAFRALLGISDSPATGMGLDTWEEGQTYPVNWALMRGSDIVVSLHDDNGETPGEFNDEHWNIYGSASAFFKGMMDAAGA